MLAYAAWDMAPNALKNVTTIAMGVIAFALLILTPIHPAFVVVMGAVAGVLLKL